ATEWASLVRNGHTGTRPLRSLRCALITVQHFTDRMFEWTAKYQVRRQARQTGRMRRPIEPSQARTGTHTAHRLYILSILVGQDKQDFSSRDSPYREN